MHRYVVKTLYYVKSGFMCLKKCLPQKLSKSDVAKLVDNKVARGTVIMRVALDCRWNTDSF